MPLLIGLLRFRLKSKVVLELVVSPPLRFKVPYPEDKPAPGAMVCAAVPACTRPLMEPPAAPAASVPPFRVTAPEPNAEPLPPLAAISMPAPRVVPPA